MAAARAAAGPQRQYARPLRYSACERRAVCVVDPLAGSGADLPLVRPVPVPEGDVHARHLYSVLVTPETGWTRDALIAHLAKAGVATSVHFRALHLHPYYQERYRLQRGMFPEAERVSDQVVSLPLGGGMSDDEAWIVVEALRRAISVRTR